jgi:hypothetical protein
MAISFTAFFRLSPMANDGTASTQTTIQAESGLRAGASYLLGYKLEQIEAANGFILSPTGCSNRNPGSRLFSITLRLLVLKQSAMLKKRRTRGTA